MPQRDIAPLGPPKIKPIPLSNADRLAATEAGLKVAGMTDRHAKAQTVSGGKRLKRAGHMNLTQNLRSRAV